jgi:two-component system phosphate regulon sensor histidine kinase PhoR
MDYLQKLLRQTKVSLFLLILFNNVSLFLIWLLADKVFHFNQTTSMVVIAIVALVEMVALAFVTTGILMGPLTALWQAILHLSPDPEVSQQPPQMDSLGFGKDLVVDLMSHIYQFVNIAQKTDNENQARAKDLSKNFVAQNMPIPLIVLDGNESIKFTNPAAAQYLGFKQEDLIGKNIYMVLDMAFPSEDTFDVWLKKAKTSTATAANTWERVKLDVRDNHPMYLFDLAAYYNRDNPDHNETMMLLFDHTKSYSQDEQAISFVALSVHELRAPLTLLRGYIDVFEDELSGQLNPELQGFMDKMHSQAEQLMVFVNNILNVARIDDDQLELQLQEEDWAAVLKASVQAVEIRAKVRDIVLELTIADDLPKVAIDRLSVQEVINNLIDNAIKYSGKSKIIKIDTHLTKDKQVETTIQDYGLGIPATSIPNLFTKFYRDYHNRSQVGGTGLGLYLSNAIVKGNGGNLWVRSKEGQGSTFGFTLQPYNSLDLNANKDKKDLVRGAHGWIKNHSLYRQ